MYLKKLVSFGLATGIFILTFTGCQPSSITSNSTSTTLAPLTTTTTISSGMTVPPSSTFSTSLQTGITTVSTSATVVSASTTVTTQEKNSSVSTSTTTTPVTDDSDRLLAQELDSADFTLLASDALRRYYQKYWKGSATDGYIQSDTPSMIWELAMGVFAMESYYEATNDTETKNRLSAEWEHLKSTFSKEKLVANMGSDPNIAADDAGWDAMVYLTFYRMTGDPLALQYAKECVLNAYDYFKDGDLSNGMWYCNTTQYNGDQWKSLYSASQVIVALEYCELTKGTSLYDEALYSETMKLYQWLEENLCRDAEKTYINCFQDGTPYTLKRVDYLYWCDFNVNRDGRTERNGPDGLVRSNDISWNGSISALFGNMAMAAIQAKLYRMTGQSIYLTKSLRTAAAITKRYKTTDNTYINDRDHNTNAAFAYYYVKEVLTLPGIAQKDINRFANTGYVIASYGLTEDGYYHTNWQKNARSKGTEYRVCAVMGTNVHLITGSALIQELDLFKY